MSISKSDLLIVNRVLAHESIPTERRFFKDKDDNFRCYNAKQAGVMKADEAKRDLSSVCRSMLSSLSEVDCKRLLSKYRRTEHLKIIAEIASSSCSYEDLKSYAPIF